MHPLHLLFTLPSVVLSGGPQGLPARPALGEAELRARVVAVVGKFVKWPPLRGANSARPFTIAILGTDPFEGHLERLAGNLEVSHRKVQILYLRTLREEDLAEMDILFVGGLDEDRLHAALHLLRGRPVLIMGGRAGLARQGVMLNLPLKEGFLAPEVNLRAVREADLEISPAFLAKANARIVDAN